MGTSSSGSGPKGRSPLLPNWATEGDHVPGNDDDQIPEAESPENEESNDDQQSGDATSNDYSYADALKTAKSAIKRIVNNRNGATFKRAAKNYISRTGGHRNATHSSSAGISAGTKYIGFIGNIATKGLDQTLSDLGLSDCIGKSTEEVFAKIANKIAPIGSTNDEAIARTAMMMALDKLYDKLIENDLDIDRLDQLDEQTLSESVIEFVSAYIFKKWVYEAGLALERNELSEAEAVELENEMRIFVTDEVKSGLDKIDILSFDVTKGEGRKLVKEIFDLAYSTLEK